jgi:DNA-binding transcriptional LysR family regulator
LKLTEEGVAFYASAKKLLQDFDHITEFAKNKRKALTGSIHISMPLSFTVFNPVTDLLTQFLHENEEIFLQLNYSNYMQDLIADNVDIAFRSSTENVIGYGKFKMVQYQIGYYASPEYLKQHAKITKPEDLQNHNCLVNQQTYFSEWYFKGIVIHAKGNVKTNSPEALTQLALRGLGIIRASQMFIQAELDGGKLVPVLEAEWVAPLEIYLYYRNVVGTPYRVQALVDFMKKTL